MDTTTQLFIRACKSLNPKLRVKSVYNRFYGKFDDSDVYIAGLLLNICEDYKLLSISKLASELDPNNFKHLYNKNENSYHQKVINACIPAIRFTKKEQLEGFIPPKRFR